MWGVPSRIGGKRNDAAVVPRVIRVMPASGSSSVSWSIMTSQRNTASPLLINGVLTVTGPGFETVNSATEEVIGEASDAGLADLDRATEAARKVEN